MHFANILYSYYAKTFAKNTVIMQQEQHIYSKFTPNYKHITCVHCVHVYVYKCGDKLFGERTRTLLESWLTELCFAYDAAIMATTKDSIVQATVELDRVVRTCRLTISIPKTMLLVAGRNITQNDLDPILISGGTIETVSSFHFLGSVVGWSAMVVFVRN